jgi:glutamate racemase
VEQIEDGKINHPLTREILIAALTPMLDAGVDEVVMGCTHYPFVIPIIREIIGDQIRVIDPAPAIARQTGRLLETYDLQASGDKPGEIRFLTSGDPKRMENQLLDLLNIKTIVEKLNWDRGILSAG